MEGRCTNKCFRPLLCEVRPETLVGATMLLKSVRSEADACRRIVEAEINSRGKSWFRSDLCANDGNLPPPLRAQSFAPTEPI